jgi:HPt (histidine-containing phosphotransfer) domain-containing protein
MNEPFDDIVLNLPEIINRLGGDREFAAECVDLFESELPGMLTGLREAIARGSCVDVNRAAHTIKGAAANFCVTGPTLTAAEMERLTRDGRLDEAGPLQPALERQLDGLVSKLQQLKAPDGSS